MKTEQSPSLHLSKLIQHHSFYSQPALCHNAAVITWQC